MFKTIKTIIWASIALLSLVASGLTYHHYFSYKLPPVLSFSHGHIKLVTQEANLPTETQTTSSTPSGTTTPNTIYKSKPKAPVPSYGEMVLFYQNRRIQFDDNCRAIPSQQVFANGVSIMLDNRTQETKKITIGSKVYNVAGYNYVLVTLKEKSLPLSLYINCNGQLNTAVVTVE